jgi:ABC-2 type transport system ATP-binding protein
VEGGVNISELRKEKYWGRYANTYDEFAEYVVGKTVRQAIINKLSEERDLGEVIEFGCGTGYFTKAVAKNAKHVIATDLSEEMLEMARRQLKEFRNVIVRKADCEERAFPLESADTVFMANIIHAIENPLRALQQSDQILKQGGLLLIVSYTDYGMNWFEKMELGIRYLLRFGVPPPYGLRNYSPEELSLLVESAGFKVESAQLIGYKPRALYLKSRKQ